MIFHLVVPMFIILIGILGLLLSRKNILLIIMSLEILLLCVNYNFILFSQIIDDVMGQVISLLIICVAASESALGLAIIILFYKKINQ
uniref:NADH-ubiquinone oxidoreductase chain 4L n=1 Tax=Pleurostomum flabellatum TaxID=405751 RepID=A0A7T0M440_9EUKA|nr:NADH dehydrogenase subunit 4L [Pleurostomum flabellatum]QPL15633.1 NADH dehydrogenase subunit 4L [Pleurostomum flabellatum]